MGPENLSRPLAQRVRDLPEAIDTFVETTLSPATIEAGVAALKAGKTHYTDRPGILGLRVWVVNILQRQYGLQLQPNQVTITCGGAEARFVTVKYLTIPDQYVVCPGDASRVAGAVALSGAALVKEVSDPARVAMLYLTPHDDLQIAAALLKQAADNGWWVVWDMSDSAETDFHPAADETIADQVVTIGSLDDRLPGWRIGWMAGSKIASQLKAYKQSLTICSPSISQWAALGMLENDDD
jgi:aspartate/methionine/tyrosine aminotransferase